LQPVSNVTAANTKPEQADTIFANSNQESIALIGKIKKNNIVFIINLFDQSNTFIIALLCNGA
jgi:hypothetical protein